MKIAVCVKQVPDSWAEKKMQDGRLDRLNVDAVLNDLDEYAVEEALRIVEANGGNGEGGPNSVTVISMAQSALSMRRVKRSRWELIAR
jgi:electron transfer flavoprotein beta subunit